MHGSAYAFQGASRPKHRRFKPSLEPPGQTPARTSWFKPSLEPHGGLNLRYFVGSFVLRGLVCLKYELNHCFVSGCGRKIKDIFSKITSLRKDV